MGYQMYRACCFCFYSSSSSSTSLPHPFESTAAAAVERVKDSWRSPAAAGSQTSASSGSQASTEPAVSACHLLQVSVWVEPQPPRDSRQTWPGTRDTRFASPVVVAVGKRRPSGVHCSGWATWTRRAGTVTWTLSSGTMTTTTTPSSASWDSGSLSAWSERNPALDSWPPPPPRRRGCPCGDSY